ERKVSQISNLSPVLLSVVGLPSPYPDCQIFTASIFSTVQVAIFLQITNLKLSKSNLELTLIYLQDL
ncbi:hypothetical protein J0J30_23930, partial [Vibrio vulnificus]|nr:hypothetical protein [Vibrio vulnificus]